jgi:arylsulfatase A-like enzyme
MYEGGIRIPMVVRWPGKIKAGTVSDKVWAFWDFLPTAAEIAGLPFENSTDGISVLPTLMGEEQKLHDYLYWDYGHVRDEFVQAARWENWKGIGYNQSGKIEIFNLDKDPGEGNNLVSKRPDLVKRFKEIIKEAYVPSDDYPVVVK